MKGREGGEGKKREEKRGEEKGGEFDFAFMHTEEGEGGQIAYEM